MEESRGKETNSELIKEEEREIYRSLSSKVALRKRG